jgi:hypothetical protein
VGEEPGPAGDLAPAGVAGGRVVGRDDAGGRRRQAGGALIVAPAQAAGGVPVVVLNQDLPQGLHLGAAQQARVAARCSSSSRASAPVSFILVFGRVGFLPRRTGRP